MFYCCCDGNTRSHLFHLQVQLICRMEIGHKSSTRGLLLVCLIMGLAPSGFRGGGGGGFCTGRCSMFSTHTHTPFGRDGCRENVFLFSSSRSLLLHSLNKPVLPSHNQEGRRPETRTRLTVFLRRSDCRRFLAHTPPPPEFNLQLFGFADPYHHMNAILSSPPVEAHT